MTDNELREILQEHFNYDEEILNKIHIIDGFTDAVIGISHDNRLIYSYDKMINILMERDNISHTDAIEYIDYNVIRSLHYYNPIVMYSLMSLD